MSRTDILCIHEISNFILIFLYFEAIPFICVFFRLLQISKKCSNIFIEKNPHVSGFLNPCSSNSCCPSISSMFPPLFISRQESQRFFFFLRVWFQYQRVYGMKRGRGPNQIQKTWVGHVLSFVIL